MTYEEFFDDPETNDLEIEDKDQPKQRDKTSEAPQGEAKEERALSEDFSKASPSALKDILRSFATPLLTGFQTINITDSATELVGNNPAARALEAKWQEGERTKKPTLRPQEEKELARAIYTQLHEGGDDKRISYLIANGFATNIIFDGTQLTSFELRKTNGKGDTLGPKDEFIVGANSKYLVERYIWARQKLQITNDGVESALRAQLMKDRQAARLTNGGGNAGGGNSGENRGTPKGTNPTSDSPLQPAPTPGDTAPLPTPADTPPGVPAAIDNPPGTPAPENPPTAPPADVRFSSGTADASKGKPTAWGLAWDLTFGAYPKMDDAVSKVIPWGIARYTAEFAAYQLANRMFGAGTRINLGSNKINWIPRTVSGIGWLHTAPVRLVDAPATAFVRGLASRNLDWVNNPRLRSIGAVDRWLDNHQFTDLAAARQPGRNPGAQVMIMLNNVYSDFATNPSGRNGDVRSPNKVTWNNFYTAMSSEYKSWTRRTSSWFTGDADKIAKQNLEEVRGFRDRTRGGARISETPEQFCIRAARRTIMSELKPENVSDFKTLIKTLEERARNASEGQLLEREACASIINEAQKASNNGKNISDFLAETNDRNIIDADEADELAREEAERAPERPLGRSNELARDRISGNKLEGVSVTDRAAMDRLFNDVRDIVFEESIDMSRGAGRKFWNFKSSFGGRDREARRTADPKTQFASTVKTQTERMISALAGVQNEHNAAVIEELAQRLNQSRKDFSVSLSASRDSTLYDCVEDLGYRYHLPYFPDDEEPVREETRRPDVIEDEMDFDPDEERVPPKPSEATTRVQPELARIITDHATNPEELGNEAQDLLFDRTFARFKREGRSSKSSSEADRARFVVILAEEAKELKDAAAADSNLGGTRIVKELNKALNASTSSATDRVKGAEALSPDQFRTSIVRARSDDEIEADEEPARAETAPSPKPSDKLVSEEPELARIIIDHATNREELGNRTQDLLLERATARYKREGRSTKSTSEPDRARFVTILNEESRDLKAAFNDDPALKGTRVVTELTKALTSTTSSATDRVKGGSGLSPDQFRTSLVQARSGVEPEDEPEAEPAAPQPESTPRDTAPPKPSEKLTHDQPELARIIIDHAAKPEELGDKVQDLVLDRAATRYKREGRSSKSTTEPDRARFVVILAEEAKELRDAVAADPAFKGTRVSTEIGKALTSTTSSATDRVKGGAALSPDRFRTSIVQARSGAEPEAEPAPEPVAPRPEPTATREIPAPKPSDKLIAEHPDLAEIIIKNPQDMRSLRFAGQDLLLQRAFEHYSLQARKPDSTNNVDRKAFAIILEDEERALTEAIKQDPNLKGTRQAAELIRVFEGTRASYAARINERGTSPAGFRQSVIDARLVAPPEPTVTPEPQAAGAEPAERMAQGTESGGNALGSSEAARPALDRNEDLADKVSEGPFLEDGALRANFLDSANFLIDDFDTPEMKETDLISLIEDVEGIPEGRLQNVGVKFTGAGGQTGVEFSVMRSDGTGAPPTKVVFHEPITIDGDSLVGESATGDEIREPIKNVHKIIMLGVDAKDLSSSDETVRQGARREALRSFLGAVNGLCLEAENYRGITMSEVFSQGREAVVEHLPNIAPKPELVTGETLRDVANAPDRATDLLREQAEAARAEGPKLFLRSGQLALRTPEGKEITKTNRIEKEIRKLLTDALAEAKGAETPDTARIAALQGELEKFEADKQTYLDDLKVELASEGFAAEAERGVSARRVIGVAGTGVALLMIFNATAHAREKVSETKRPETPRRKSDDN